MNISLSIIDQRTDKIAEDFHTELEEQIGRKLDPERLRSAAFTLLCVKAVLDIDFSEALEYITEGGNDGGIDAMHVSDIQDGEFTVSLFQSKYRRKLDGASNFEENAVIKMLHAISSIFDPDKAVSLRNILLLRVEEIRSLVRDGNIPTVRVFLCNNGKYWTQDAQEKIDAAGFGKQVIWQHVNHEKLVELSQAQKPVKATINLFGKAVVEAFNFRRVLIGKLPVQAIKTLFEEHGERLLERNIRRYLGLHKNRVNEGIKDTLLHAERRQNFYFYNNGVTMTCTKFRHSALQEENYAVQIEELQVINGGQTCMTIKETLTRHPDSYDNAFVLVRLYELGEKDEDLVHEITYATNSQNPVDLRDLRSNDPLQKRLEEAVAGLGWQYKRKRDTSSGSSQAIPVSVAANAVLTVWRRKPHLAKFHGKELFGKYYEIIFNDQLNAAQLVLAVLVFRSVDSERKRQAGTDETPRFLSYATHFLAMILGRYLLEESGVVTMEKLDHRNFVPVKEYLELHKSALYRKSMVRLKQALAILALDDETVSLQRLAAAFRRGDLLEVLNR
ncbi:MAG: AIPR family protein [Candidatus Electrothrix sp. Rat3]|nr:AIPR family protein [Candidatus Electrothrix rattekaaiensis]